MTPSSYSQARTARPPRWRWLLVALWMGVIFFMSAQSTSGEQSRHLTEWIFQLLGLHPATPTLQLADHYLRKTAHFSEYAVLASLLWWALRAPFANRFGIAWGVATLYAASDEAHQIFVPTRGPSVYDVMLDSCGALAALIVIALVTRAFRR